MNPELQVNILGLVTVPPKIVSSVIVPKSIQTREACAQPLEKSPGRLIHEQAASIKTANYCIIYCHSSSIHEFGVFIDM